jgi:TonB family protein
MPTAYTPGRTNFGLLPEPEGRSIGFITSCIVNGTILGIILIVGSMARQVITQHYEMTELIVPTTPPPPIKIKQPPPPKLQPPPEQPKLQMQEMKPRQIQLPKPIPEPKQVQMEAKVNLPVVAAKPQIVRLQPQPKSALAAAMPAQNSQVKPSTAPVHLGDTFGATPNPNATRPATIASIGNPYGGNQGPAVAPHGVVGSTGIGNGLKSGSNAGVVGKVASAGIPGETGTGNTPSYGRVASAGIPAATAAVAAPKLVSAPVQSTAVEVLSKPSVVYTSEARQLHVEGDVVLSVTFLASGQVVVNGILQGLGHGLDEEARRVASQIRFRPATNNGRPVDVTTKIRITFQLA